MIADPSIPRFYRQTPILGVIVNANDSYRVVLQGEVMSITDIFVDSFEPEFLLSISDTERLALPFSA